MSSYVTDIRWTVPYRAAFQAGWIPPAGLAGLGEGKNPCRTRVLGILFLWNFEMSLRTMDFGRLTKRPGLAEQTFGLSACL